MAARAPRVFGLVIAGHHQKTRAALPRHIPLVGNGDVKTLEDYIRMRVETGCDAVMIGRGALGNPWLFRDIRAWLRGETPPGPPSLSERRTVFLRHVDLMRTHTRKRRSSTSCAKPWLGTKGPPRLRGTAGSSAGAPGSG